VHGEVPPDPVYFEQAVNLSRPTTIREAYENILKLSEMKAQGQPITPAKLEV
jgi:hypothetical protein